MEERPGNGVLVDTGVWVDFFKAGSEMGDRLEGLISEGSVWVCGIVLFELLQGVRSADERDR
ncbi:MAG: PIN domain-containing protein, partial [Chloroflexota bacterium]